MCLYLSSCLTHLRRQGRALGTPRSNAGLHTNANTRDGVEHACPGLGNRRQGRAQGALPPGDPASRYLRQYRWHAGAQPQAHRSAHHRATSGRSVCSPPTTSTYMHSVELEEKQYVSGFS